MIEKTNSRAPTKWIETASVREQIIEETTTSHIYWDVAFEFQFSKYTEEECRISHGLFRMKEDDGDAVGLVESWAPRNVFAPDQLERCGESHVRDFLGFQAEHAWTYQAVQCAPLDESDATLLERRPGQPVVCVWRYYYDHDDDLLLAQRFVLTGGFASYSRRPLLPDGEGEIKEHEETSRSPA